jgi:hypothetical protein
MLALLTDLSGLLLIAQGASRARTFFRAARPVARNVARLRVGFARSFRKRRRRDRESGLFPSLKPQPFACVAILRFSDQVGINIALSSAKTAEVLGDVKNFTNITPTIFCADD